MADEYGLTDAGFVPMQQPEVQADLQARIQLQFGNVDLSDQSVFGQLIGILSASSAQLWQAGSALYASSFPEGATGIAVDNILALNNLQRLPEAASVTNPTPVTQTNGVILYGLRLLGAPGTVVPQGTLISNGASSPVTFSTDATATIGAASNARQVVYFGNVPTTGSYQLTLASAAGLRGTTQNIGYKAMARQTLLAWGSAPTGTYTLTLGQATTASVNATGTASALQAAINALQGYENVGVTGSVATGMSLVWPAGFVPLVSAKGTGAPVSILQAVSALVHSLSVGADKPFTDVLLTDGPQSLTLDYGAFAPQQGCPSNAAQSVPRVAVAQSSLYSGQVQTSVGAQTAIVGNPAQAIVTATCTKTGAYAATAGQLTTIATPVSGLSGATNDLDCLTGRSIESDSAAIARFKAQQGSSGSGSLGSIVKRVQQVDGVSQVVAFQNTGNAAGQVLLFAQPPSSGQFSLVIAGTTTALFDYNAPAATLQAAVRQITGFSSANVSASGAAGYAFDFSGVRGGQGLGLIGVAQNTTQVQLTPYFGRPPHSIELVVEGGSDADIAKTLLSCAPAGIATYGNPTARTTATLTANSATIVLASSSGVEVGQSVEGAGVPLGAIVLSLSSATATLSAAATASGSLVPVSFGHSLYTTDAAGNPTNVAFSRPTSALIYVSLKLTTDLLLVPGVAGSGSNSNAAFDPSSIAAISAGLIDIINAVSIGGVVSARGTNGLVGSFREIPGIYDYTLCFDRSPNPTNVDSIRLQSNESPTAQSYSVAVSFV